jgi:hypothetical protein
MSIQHQAQMAMSTLSGAFAPHNCVIQAPGTKGNFSFTVVNQHGVVCHTQRLYPDQYVGSDRLQQIIDRTRKSLTA